MLWSNAQMAQYEERGFLLCPNCFGAEELSLLRDELWALTQRPSPARVLEHHGTSIRALHGDHKKSGLLGRLVRDARLLEPAMQMLEDEVYVYQFKINTKMAFVGEKWPWHQDFEFWRREDGMPAPRVLNAVLFLDEVTEFNGPLMIIPGSHRKNLISSVAPSAASNEGESEWRSHVAADLKYRLDRETVSCLEAEHGIEAPKGPAGSVLFFHGKLAHCSGVNLSPRDRRLILVTYNSVSNLPLSKSNPRPDFLVSRDSRPLIPVHQVPMV